MSCAANCITSFHRWFVQDVLNAEWGQRLVGVCRRRQVVQRTSPPVFHCITFGDFFGCHHWLYAEFIGLGWSIKQLQTSERIEGKKSHNSLEVEKKNKDKEGRLRERKSYSKMGCVQSVDPREQQVRRSEMPPWKWRGPKSWRLLTSYHWLVGNQLSPVALSPSSLSLFDYVAVQCRAFCNWGCPIN